MQGFLMNLKSRRASINDGLGLHMRSGPPDSGKVERKVTVCIQNEETLKAGKIAFQSDRQMLSLMSQQLVALFIGILFVKLQHHLDCKRDDNLVKTQRTSVGSSEASPPDRWALSRQRG
ncbi:hypothetical protein QQF64_018689 [Cirrhinus molitorella]|uniref:Uncharacterized protein n=1 Tax=Cirrhinus molitorella TaxID=172907 RepID=A0ABR3LHC5_9TELE